MVTVCTISGWVEAFPTWTEKAQEVFCALLKEIIPRYVIPISIGSDNGPAFVAEVLKELTKGLKLLGTFTQHTSLRVQTKLKA
jgi:hypothetical protein